MKRKLLTSFLVIVMSLLTPLSVGACNKQTEPPASSSKEKERFLIGSWVSYYDTKQEGCPSMSEQTKALSKAGINFIPVGSWILDVGEPIKHDVTSAEWWKHVDDVMAENGIYYNFSQNFDPNGNGNSHDELVRAVELSNGSVSRAKTIVPQLKNCIGCMLKDEPTYGAMLDVGFWGEKYLKVVPDTKIYVNMNPGLIITAYGDVFDIKGPGGYKEFLQHWVDCGGAENLEFLSHDFYPFNASDTMMSYFNDLEDMRYIGLKNNVKTHSFLQSCSWAGKRMPNIHELRWNANTYLAYGFKGFSYFNWVMWDGEGCNDGIIDMNGNIRNEALYKELINMNWEIRDMEDIIMNLDCLHAYHTLNHADFNSVELLPQGWVLQPNDSSADLIISHMQTKDTKEPYLVITNKSFTEAQTVTFKISPDSGIQSLARYNAKTKEYDEVSIINDCFTLSLDISEAAWLKITGTNVAFPD